ncbi:neural proliferation differentiation and control protein 1-like isoform X2 [Betta splendens]|uniref:Neural proliferation differentiation and control protein 1-like isoform X2 n=1 Tax=Betta splendens TaxID=158456 RepID=A0A8M1H7K0_BETSP|nr:neural proliferation differentiation and control protein 1-like isoform X2 [Betta splendens]
MRAPGLGQAAFFSGLMVLSHCLTGSPLCPRSLDCAQAGRHFCLPGGSRCGPCLRPLVEDSHGRCVRRRHAAHSAPITEAKMSSDPDLDQEIDFLSAIISEQRTESRLPAPSSLDVSQPESQQASDAASDRARATEQPSSQRVAFRSTAPPSSTTRLSTAILPYTSDDQVFIVMSSVFIAASSLALIVAGACWVRLQKGFTKKVNYPAYGLVTTQNFDKLPGDKKLAHSAQMYHYQHQKQQMLSLEKHREEPKVPDSGASTDEENEDGDFTVYECPGLAPTGEMEVKNPLFDDSTLYLQRFHK